MLDARTLDRFWSKVHHEPMSGCWLWEGSTNGGTTSGTGHGKFFLRRDDRGRTVKDYAHRIAWMLERGPIPPGRELDHLCRNPSCCNPDHLEPVTHAENIRRGPGAMTKCRKGHPFTPETTGRNYAPDGSLRRYCLACRRIRRARVEPRP